MAIEEPVVPALVRIGLFAVLASRKVLVRIGPLAMLASKIELVRIGPVGGVVPGGRAA